MQTALASLSNELAKLVEEFQPYVVAVHARAHFPSSGIIWKPGVVATADHTVRRDEDIQVTLADGKRVDATLAGRDPGSDIAVLKVEGLGPSAAPTTEPPRPRQANWPWFSGAPPIAAPTPAWVSSALCPGRGERGAAGDWITTSGLTPRCSPIRPEAPWWTAGASCSGSRRRGFRALPAWPFRHLR